MIVYISKWNEIRDQFSEDEKTALNAAICGQIICPQGIVIDESKVGSALLEKTKQLLGVEKDHKRK